jgi:hypothetical protein
MIEKMQTLVAELAAALELTNGVIDGTPWVIQMAPGAYLVSQPEGFGPGSVLRTCCYSAQRIDAAVDTVREQCGAVFTGIRKMRRADALRLELEAARNILARMQQACAA